MTATMTETTTEGVLCGMIMATLAFSEQMG